LQKITIERFREDNKIVLLAFRFSICPEIIGHRELKFSKERSLEKRG
jgi:hypothetical protein